MDVKGTRHIVKALVVGGVLAVMAVYLVASNDPSDPAPVDSAAPGPIADDADPVAPVDPNSVYDPVRAGEETPPTYRQLLGRDQIEPIYNPTFTTADDSGWPSETLVIGVEGIKTFKAYPVSFLNRREMVIDHIDGDPILVTW